MALIDKSVLIRVINNRGDGQDSVPMHTDCSLGSSLSKKSNCNTVSVEPQCHPLAIKTILSAGFRELRRCHVH